MLKAKPNLESRIRTLKRDWSIVYDMLSGKTNSGFGWDEHRQLVVAEDAVWNSYINVRIISNQATRKDAQTAVDIIEEIDVEDVATINNHEERKDFYGCEADVSLDDMDLSATQPQPARNQEGLTKDERYRALSKILDHPMQMLIFFSLPSFVRLEWV
ncbi:hypothetical protein Gotur_010915, partial [Gossypium turneri]